MSFDVFFQGFSVDEARPGGGDEMREVLGPHVHVQQDQADPSRLHMVYGDGSADVHLGADSMMANRVSGKDPWDLLLSGAQAARWIIIPIGCPVCVTDLAQERDLPEELRDEIAIVRSGADLLRVIESS